MVLLRQLIHKLGSSTETKSPSLRSKNLLRKPQEKCFLHKPHQETCRHMRQRYSKGVRSSGIWHSDVYWMVPDLSHHEVRVHFLMDLLTSLKAGEWRQVFIFAKDHSGTCKSIVVFIRTTKLDGTSTYFGTVSDLIGIGVSFGEEKAGAWSCSLTTNLCRR